MGELQNVPSSSGILLSVGELPHVPSSSGIMHLTSGEIFKYQVLHPLRNYFILLPRDNSDSLVSLNFVPKPKFKTITELFEEAEREF